MPRPFIPLDVDQFAERLRTFTFTRRITAVHMHHTFSPRQTDYRGEPTIDGMFRFHTQTNGWSDIAQHLSIAPDGTIWTGRDWNRTPASATGFNEGAFMFETIGDFDVGQERLEGAQRRAVIEVIARVQLECGLPIDSLHFHREFTDQKTCPGTGISKAEILAEVRQARERVSGRTRTLAAPHRGAGARSRRVSVHAPPAGDATDRPSPDAMLERSRREYDPERAVDVATNGDDGEVECGPVPTRSAPVLAAHGPRLLRALCVGINAYPGEARLSGCVNDANAWARVFRGLQFEQVDLLVDEDATQDRIRQELQALVRAGSPGDVLVFQYSGHGTTFSDQAGAGDEDDGQDEAIVPVDFSDGRFLLDDELFEIFGSLRDGVALTCFFDCCHSGTISRAVISTMAREIHESRGGDVRARFIDPTPAMIAEYRARRAATRGLRSRAARDVESMKVVTFSACRDDELALESDGHGRFTSIVAPLVQAAFDAGTSNDDFQQGISAAFGAEASQHPALDCASSALNRPVLRMGEAMASLPLPPSLDRVPRPSAATTVSTTAARNGKRMAVCVGIDSYPKPNELAGCVNDAKTWASLLGSRQFGFDVQLCLNEQATRAEIMRRLADMVDSAVPGDVLVFQYAGHGTQLPDVDGDDEEDGQDEALVPVDFAGGRFLIDDDLRDIFSRLRDGVSLTCFMDCCHSGTITRMLGFSGRDGDDDSRKRFMDVPDEIVRRYEDIRRAEARDRSRAFVDRTVLRWVTFSACDAAEVAFETRGSGDFTRTATPILQAGVDGVSNREFQRRVVRAFGDRRRQTPQLDCGLAAEELDLLGGAAPARDEEVDRRFGDDRRREGSATFDVFGRRAGDRRDGDPRIGRIAAELRRNALELDNIGGE
jgi:hypothetical protein